MVGRVIAINTSRFKGTRKRNIKMGQLAADFGLVGDAHAGPGIRQVSLLPIESILREPFRSAGLGSGDFAENLTTEGIALSQLSIGSLLSVGSKAVLKVTQKGKECHGGCEVSKLIGDCIMPTEGIFAQVLRGGVIFESDRIELINPRIAAAILTVSDKGSTGQRVDSSAPILEQLIETIGGKVVWYRIVPDECAVISEALLMAVESGMDLVLTTGGTGLSPRDVTPEATRNLIDRELPGFSEIMRLKGYESTPRAILSRGVSGVRGRTIICNLPGSRKGSYESLLAIIEAIPHAIDIIKGMNGDCGVENTGGASL